MIENFPVALTSHEFAFCLVFVLCMGIAIGFIMGTLHRNSQGKVDRNSR